MSRAISSAFVVAAALSVVAMPAMADPSRRAHLGQRPSAVPLASPSDVAPSHWHHRRLAPLAVQPTPRFFTEQVWRIEETVASQTRVEPQARPVRMRSGNPVDPGAVVSRTPSGRVVIGPPPGYVLPYPAVLEGGEGRPYAPPQFTIIGAPPARNMGSPVKLTHGVKPPETLKTGPKVVWLDEAGGDDAGGRVKRLR